MVVKVRTIKYFLIEWGSEIKTSLNFKWSKRGWVANYLDFKWDLECWSPTIWNPDKNVQILKSSFQVVGTKVISIAKARPFKIQPLKSPVLKCFQISNGWISDLHCITFLCELCLGVQGCSTCPAISGSLHTAALVPDGLAQGRSPEHVVRTLCSPATTTKVSRNLVTQSQTLVKQILKCTQSPQD